VGVRRPSLEHAELSAPGSWSACSSSTSLFFLALYLDALPQTAGPSPPRDAAASSDVSGRPFTEELHHPAAADLEYRGEDGVSVRLGIRFGGHVVAAHG
jgi:hypothetical protein